MDADLSAAYLGTCVGCGCSISSFAVGCPECTARHPAQAARAAEMLTHEVEQLRREVEPLRAFRASWHRGSEGPAGALRHGRSNPYTLYWQERDAEPRDGSEERVGMALTPEWAQYIVAASRAVERLAGGDE